MSVFDASALVPLVEGTGSWSFVQTLVRTYQSLLRPRVTRLSDALVGDDVDVAMDAALSLRVSSTMMGADELAELARAVESHVRAGDTTAARARATLMPRAVQVLDEAISDYLARGEHPG